MKKNVITIGPNMNICEACHIMLDNQVGCLVASVNDKPVGILTEKDIIKMICKHEKECKTIVKDIMTNYLITVKPNEKLEKAIETMRTYKIKKLPVIDNNDRLVGIITATDIISIEPEIFKIIEDVRKLKL